MDSSAFPTFLPAAFLNCFDGFRAEAAVTPIGILGVFDEIEKAADVTLGLSAFSHTPPAENADSGYCGGPTLLNLSYPMPEHFPFQPIQLVMERTPRTCDLYSDRHFCKKFSDGKLFEPEYHVREVFASFLSGCHARSCMTLDLGANNGWFTSYALSLGSRAIAVEPQGDLAKAIAQTVELNCWAGRGVVLNAFAGVTSSSLWRASSARTKISVGPVVALEDLLSSQRVFELVKMDADGPEGVWMDIVDKMLSQGQVDIKTIVVECNGCSAQVIVRFQQHYGYDVFLLNMHVDARFLNSKGIDEYSKFPEKQLPSILEEMYSIRFMRHVYHVKPNATENDLQDCWDMTHPFPNQYVFTKVALLEPRFEHPLARMMEKAEEEFQEHQQAAAKVAGSSRSGASCYRCFKATSVAETAASMMRAVLARLKPIGVNFGISLRQCGDPRGTIACVCRDGPCSSTEDTCWLAYCEVEKRCTMQRKRFREPMHMQKVA